MRKKNGFSFPLHPLQILSWLLSLWHIFISILYLCLSNSYPLSCIFPVLFFSSQILIAILAFIITKTDPSQGSPTGSKYLSTSDQYAFYCTVCKYYVSNTARHCGYCDKCIEGFDHHCKWLNTCIGKPNYKRFIVLLILTEFNLAVLIGFEIYFLKENLNPLVFFIYADIGISVFAFISLGYLIGFHVYLKFEGITTYEFIKRRKKKQKITPDGQVGKNAADRGKFFCSKSVEHVKTKDDNNIVHSLSKEDLGVSISYD